MSSAERRRLCLSPDALAVRPIEISGGPLRHLHVLRLRSGDRVSLFDGQGREVEARIVSVERDRALAVPMSEVSEAVEPSLACWVVQAIAARPQRMDTVVRQLTEIGVACVVPVLSERSQSFARQDTAVRKRHMRWQRIAASAAEQCGRRVVPRIFRPCPLAELPWEELPAPILLLDPGVGAVRLKDAALSAAPREVTVMIGPEGGWTGAELDLLRSRGAEPVSLGPRVLRTETASLVAASIVLHQWGDLG